MILTVMCRPDLDRALAKRISLWLWKVGFTDAEFYVWGDDAAA